LENADEKWESEVLKYKERAKSIEADLAAL
jgi:hypothetical protein